MIRPLVIMALCGLTTLAASLPTGGPVLVELFTSESCTACPAAERTLDRFANNAGVIVLTEHIDYLDTSWKDPFASPLFATRQLDYAAAMQSHDVATPEIVVNGEKAFAGDNFSNLTAAIFAPKGPRAPVTVKWVRGACRRSSTCASISLSVGTLPAMTHKSDVLLAIAENAIQSHPTAGENADVPMQHANVVRSLTKIAEVDPAKPGEYTAEMKLTLRSEWARANLKFVIFVQDQTNRHILGAASVGMPRYQ